MIGYEKYNSLKDQWEYTDLSQNVSSRVHDYGDPQSTFDADLAIMALAAKQRQYNQLSSQQKANLYWAKEYRRKNYFVWNQSRRPRKQVEKDNEKHQKKVSRNSRRNHKYVLGKTRQNIKELKNGWYKAYSDFGNHLLERTIHINNSKIDRYINGMGCEVNVLNVTEKYNNEYKLFLKIKNEKFEIPVFIIDEETVKTPKIVPSAVLMLYTKSSNVIGHINVIVKSNGTYHPLNAIEYSLQKTPSCSQKRYVASIVLPAGNCTYYAFSETSFWSDKIELEPNDCKKINLIN